MTVTVERVVLATDGSEPARTAATHALFLARVLDAPLHVVSATGTSPAAAAETAEPSVSAAFEAEEAVSAVVRRALLADVRATSEVADGPAAAVVERAVGEGDLLVIGRRGQTGSGRFLVGSVAERLLGAPPVPTLAVPAAATDPEYRTVALLADGESSSGSAAPLARRIAAATRATLQPLTIVDGRDAAVGSRETLRALEAEARARLNDVVAAAARDAVESGGTVRIGEPAAELLAHVERVGADVVVVGVERSGREIRRFRRTEHRADGVVASRVVRHAGVPVLVAPSVRDSVKR
ncbi:universal stress protein [Haloferax prahovense]|uniref:universal stress protein n=1 Tax=Haloferax prahovense TaxID=381852 RepID=UPI000678EE7B|nr:universal stress protein [Haloferax prahovense]